MKIENFRTAGLGDATYLLTHEGVGILVDPQRDAERFLRAGRGGVPIRFVLETHMHNDYVSGGREAARRTGAELVLPAGAGAAYDHVPAFHLEDLPAGDGLTIRPIHTPGHTPEHVSYLILIDEKPVALFSGGSLLVGSAGRSDLLGMPRFQQLAYAQFRTIRRLMTLPDDVELLPTHGEGSFCTATGAGRTTSTIGLEREQNPVVQYPDRETFAEQQRRGLVPYPRYYAQMGPINILGPEPLPDRRIPDLAPADLKALGDGVQIIDARPRAEFAAGHIPGALGFELTDQFGVWVGWIVPFNAPLVLVLNDDQEVAEAAVQLARIGYDNVQGVLRGLSGWREAGYPVASYRTVDVAEFAAAVESGDAAQVLDARAPDEWEAGHLPGSVHRYVPDLTKGAPAELDRKQAVWVACGSGYRATIAASLLECDGYQPVVLTPGGVPDVLQRTRAAAST